MFKYKSKPMPIHDLESFPAYPPPSSRDYLIILWEAPFLTYRDQTLQIDFAGSLL